jgi:hypothetical protein
MSAELYISDIIRQLIAVDDVHLNFGEKEQKEEKLNIKL